METGPETLAVWLIKKYVVQGTQGDAKETGSNFAVFARPNKYPTSELPKFQGEIEVKTIHQVAAGIG